MSAVTITQTGLTRLPYKLFRLFVVIAIGLVALTGTQANAQFDHLADKVDTVSAISVCLAADNEQQGESESPPPNTLVTERRYQPVRVTFAPSQHQLQPLAAFSARAPPSHSSLSQIFAV